MYNVRCFWQTTVQKAHVAHARKGNAPQQTPPIYKTALQFDWLSRNQTHKDLDEIVATHYDKGVYY